MATQYTTVEIFVLVDEDGDYEVGTTEEQVAERYDETVGNDSSIGRRLVKVTVKVPLPTVIELTGEVQADETESGLKVA